MEKVSLCHVCWPYCVDALLAAIGVSNEIRVNSMHDDNNWLCPPRSLPLPLGLNPLCHLWPSLPHLFFHLQVQRPHAPLCLTLIISVPSASHRIHAFRHVSSSWSRGVETKDRGGRRVAGRNMGLCMECHLVCPLPLTPFSDWKTSKQVYSTWNSSIFPPSWWSGLPNQHCYCIDRMQPLANWHIILQCFKAFKAVIVCLLCPCLICSGGIGWWPPKHKWKDDTSIGRLCIVKYVDGRGAKLVALWCIHWMWTNDLMLLD